MSPTFSIIIPAYNEEHYISKTIESIFQQSVKEFEMIVVANGCTDRTEEIVRNLNKNNSTIRLLSLPKANVSVARNAGALNAQGEILIFLDADTQLSNNCLQIIKEKFLPSHSIATTKTKPNPPRFKYKAASSFKNFYLSAGLYKGCSGALICRKDAFHKYGGYNPQLTMKEHRKLTLSLLSEGKYTCFDTYATTSMRRYAKWGLTKATFFWIRAFFQDKRGKLTEEEYEKIR